MFRGTYRGGAAGCAGVLRVAGLALAIAAGNLLVAGCTTTGQLALGPLSGSGQLTVAFDSIDGPPAQLYDKLVSRLREEARAQQVATVSRESAAQYRIRGYYLAAHTQGKNTTITWVWNVFNADRELAVRLAGEVPGAASERTWAAADDAVVAQLARDGITRLAAFLASPGEAPAGQFPRGEAPSVASTTNAEGSLAFLPPSRQ